MIALKGLALAAVLGLAVGWVVGLDLAVLNELTGTGLDVIVLALVMGALAAGAAVVMGLVPGSLVFFALRRRWGLVPCIGAGGLAGLLWLDFISRDYGAHQWFDLRNANLSYPFAESLARAGAWLLLALLIGGLLVGIARRLPGRLGRRAVYAALGGLAALTLFNAAVARRHEPAEPAAHVRGEGRKLFVLMDDGTTWDIYDPLLAAGRLPRLQALIAGGHRGSLGTEHPTESPRLWTIAATGKSPSESGITDFLNVKIRGVRAPIRDYRWYGPTTLLWSRMSLLYLGRTPMASLLSISSAQRKVPAIWNMLDRMDGSSAVLNWWGTQPPERLGSGVMIAGEASGPQSSWPEEWMAEFDSSGFRVDEGEIEALFGPIPAQPSARLEEGLSDVRRAARDDLEWFDVAERVLARGQPELMMLGVRGIDAISHVVYVERTLYQRDARGDHVLSGYERRFTSNEEIDVFGPAVDRLYELHDERMGRILDMLEPDTVILLVSDHGHLYDGGNHLATSPPGVLVMAGVEADLDAVADADLYDLTPTMLRLLGLPRAEDMRGECLAVLPPQPGLPQDPHIASYGVRESGALAGEMSPEAERALRALGYIK